VADVVPPCDDYSSLGPVMRERLNKAEDLETKVYNWLLLLAERSPEANLIAREMCMLFGLETLRSNLENTVWPWAGRRG
jgi:hypothetical protein